MRCSGRLSLVALGFSVSASLAAQPSISSKPERPLTYGNSVISYLRVPAADFLPYSSDFQYEGLQSRYSKNVLGQPFVAALHLPAGAQVVYLELDYYDNDASSFVLANLQECDYFFNNCTAHPNAGAGDADCLKPGLMCSGVTRADGFWFTTANVSGDAIFINNNDNEYILNAGSMSTDGNTGFTGMLVGYVLVVSPPPATADFTDVPKTHPFFQFIEALYHSGITAGCGGGKFCPDNFLTRGQMAVYLATALGLQWQ